MVAVMRQTLKFVVGLVVSLGLLTWATSAIVQRTTRRWFENDVRLRAELVVSGAREALSAHWNDADQKDLDRTLDEITRDERIMAAAACNADLTLLTSTPGFPAEFFLPAGRSPCNAASGCARLSRGPPGTSQLLCPEARC